MMSLEQDVSELKEKLSECELKFKSPCLCALATLDAVDSLRHAQTSMWHDGTINLADPERDIIDWGNQCPIDPTPVRKTFDEIKRLLKEGEQEDAANKISDVIISILDTLFLCAGE